MRGEDLIAAVRKQYADETSESGTDLQIATYLGISIGTLRNWTASEEIKPHQIAKLLSRVENASRQKAENEVLRPVVEFFRIAPAGEGPKKTVFSTKDSNGKKHPYHSGLKDELDSHWGIYIFYDSRGRALYVGKARQQTLWKEINLVYNRDRKAQTIRRVDHPERRQDFRNYDEMRRQIRIRAVRLSDIAEYFSAYYVTDSLVNNLESLLIRSFPNDILNIRMENFTWD